jgi:dihydrofolate reductase
MLISAIAAVAQNGAIGDRGALPWHLPADLAWFRQHTTGHCVIMGRKSFQSIGRPLPRRTNIVVSGNTAFQAAGVLVATSIEMALRLAEEQGETESFIIGGGELYRQTVGYWNRVYLTEVEASPEGDVFFPELNAEDWREVFRQAHPPDGKHSYGFVFRILERNS